jgi:hypothetical protein
MFLDSAPTGGIGFTASATRPTPSPDKVWKFTPGVPVRIPGVPAYRSLGTTPPSKLPPPSLPEGVPGVAAVPADAPWFGVHTRIDLRGCRDAAAAWGLFLEGLPFYYPQAQRWIVEGSERKRRRKTGSLFAGYLFATGEAAERWCADNPDVVECLLHEPRADQLRSDLLLIEASLAQNPEVDSGGIDRPGIRVRVTRGPFMNREGTVEKLDPKAEGMRVHFTIEMLGRPVSLDLLYCDLERV